MTPYERLVPFVTDAWRAERRYRSLMALGGIIRRRFWPMDISKAAAQDRIVAVRTPHGFVPRVDPHTRQSTSEPQQFVLRDDGKLTIADRGVGNPGIIDVEWVDYR